MRIANVIKPFIFNTLTIGILLIVGCVGTPIEEKVISFHGRELNNRLTLKGKTIVLPEDWVFIRNPLKNGTHFNFRSPEGLEGGLESISFEYDIDFNKLLDFYKDHVFTSNNRIIINYIEHEKYKQIVSFSGHANNRNLYTIMVAQGNEVTFLHLSSPSDVKVSENEALLLLDTFEDDDRTWISVRQKKGMPQFSSIDNSWFWYNDFKDGYYIGRDYTGSDNDIIAGLWTLSDLDVEELQTNDQFDIKPFNYNYRIKNQNVDFTFYGQRKSYYDSVLYGVFELDSITYCFTLIQEGIGPDTDPRILLDNQGIQDLFDYHFLFTGDLQ